MGKKATAEQIAVVRSVVGVDFSEMDIIRALHLSNNQPAAAINILFDFHCKRPTPTPNLRLPTTTAAATTTTTTTTPRPSKPSSTVNLSSSLDWWLVATSDLPGLSTCKGWRKIKAGDEVDFSFPPPPPPHPAAHKRSISPSTTKLPSRGRHSSSSEILRFSTKQSVEIGRIPNEWARCLLPLVSAKKVRIDGYCKTASDELRIMDTIVLSISIYINISMFRKCHFTSFKSTHNFNEESMDHPLPALFRLLGLTPFQKAAFKPEDLYKKKRIIESKNIFGTHDAVQITDYTRKLAYRDKLKIEQENVDNFVVDNIFGTTDNSNLEEMYPPDTLECELRPYQKQALYWMTHQEKGESLEEASTTLHPCWDAYRLADKRPLVIYVNAFSGDASTEFPSSLQMARGGILADAMGLGKTIMTISLLLACSGKEGLCDSSANQNLVEAKGSVCPSSESLATATETTSNSVFSKLMKPCNSLVGGGNLIVCPMTLLSQWKAEIEIHTRPGCLTLYMHYGQSRPKDAKLLTQYDVVLTTYGVVSSEFSAENSQDNGGLYCVKWFRIILDEAHMIKSSKSQISRACSALMANRRWCLTGTPLQNNLEDIYSLLRFLQVEPWSSWSLWNKLVQKPYEEGNERGIKLVQSILKPIMLRRTKFSTDKEGRPILVLPPVNAKVIYCQLTDAEKDFYEALYKRSKVKFDQFVEQGRVLHNYASILELLLRLRQCCDHPFLVMSRGDTQDFSDLEKLANRLLKGSRPVSGPDVQPSRAFINEVVEGLRKGDKGECPICLEAFEDAILTPCAHCLCRECLLASWKSTIVGLCPICRKTINKCDLITAPTDSRFQIDIEKNWIESSKVSALLKELENLSTSGSKSIVFSQWTAFLDLLQIPLSRRSLTFVRLDGTLNQQQRERVIHKFTEEKDILVLLMSLKTGGVGINLTAASNAFLMDPWWNPAVEEQAVMRIHRIGQNNAVAIKKFIVKGTVEDRMVAVQERKQKMICGALMDQEVRAARIEELKLLFS